MKQQLPGWLSGTIVGIVAVSSVYFLGVSSTPAEERNNGKPAPAVEGTLTTGSHFSLSQYKGKVVLLNFWGTWCPPCRQELPDLIALQKKYATKDFTIVGLAENRDPSLTEPEYRTALQGFIEKVGINYPNVPVPEGAKRDFNIEAFPTSFLIDKDGRVVYACVGGIDPADMSERIEKLL